MEIEVKGHSGCLIEIKHGKNGLYLEKSTYDKSYIKRLYNQAIKQQKVSKYEFQHIRIPKIFDITVNEFSTVINMEYIYSKNFVEHFESSGFEQIYYFIYAIIKFIDIEVSRSKMEDVNRTILENKFYDVYNKILNNDLTKNDVEILKQFKLIEDRIKELPSSLKIPVGECHGDLTFSNILFNGNNYYLIDFLDSFIESPLIDMVKIRQDSAFLWSTLMFTGNFDETRMKIIAQKIDKELNLSFKKYSWYKKYYNIFQIINFIRILQYAKEKRIVVFLKEVVSKLLNYEV